MKGKKKAVEEKVEEVIEKAICADCNGSGLKDQDNLCAPCEGHGKV